MTARLHLVCASFSEGYEPINYDLLVIATDRDDAIDIWRAFYKERVDDGADPDDYKKERAEWDSKDPDQVFVIMEDELINRTPRALWWHRDIKEA